MASDKRTFKDWWDDHPVLKTFYTPAVLTATFVMGILDILVGGKG